MGILALPFRFRTGALATLSTRLTGRLATASSPHATTEQVFAFWGANTFGNQSTAYPDRLLKWRIFTYFLLAISQHFWPGMLSSNEFSEFPTPLRRRSSTEISIAVGVLCFLSDLYSQGPVCSVHGYRHQIPICNCHKHGIIIIR